MQTAAEVREEILAWLVTAGLPFRLYFHAQADTIDDCVKMPFINGDVTICKNVFLCNRQQTDFYLLLLQPHTPFRTAVVSKSLGVSRLSFAPETALREMLRLAPGSVSPLGLYYDREHRITLCYDQAVCHTPEIAFHPCDNTATVIFSQETFWNGVLPALGVTPIALEQVEQQERNDNGA